MNYSDVKVMNRNKSKQRNGIPAPLEARGIAAALTETEAEQVPEEQLTKQVHARATSKVLYIHLISFEQCFYYCRCPWDALVTLDRFDIRNLLSTWEPPPDGRAWSEVPEAEEAELAELQQERYGALSRQEAPEEGAAANDETTSHCGALS